MIKVKICGITNLADALAAVHAGADALGFVFFPDSSRFVSRKIVAEIVAHLPPFISPVGVFVNEDLTMVREIMNACGLQIAQLHGTENEEYATAVGRTVIKAVRLKDHQDWEAMAAYRVGAFLIDAYRTEQPGGTGVCVDWELARRAKLPAPMILAGGLTAENVIEAIRCVRPYGVDVSTGVEHSAGRKDHGKVRRFVAAAKAALAEVRDGARLGAAGDPPCGWTGG